MKNMSGFGSNVRVSALLCSSIAILLAGCGGGAADSTQPTNTASYLASTGSNTTPASTTATDNPAAASAQASTLPTTGSQEEQVSQLYWWLLGRRPDLGGLNFWVGTGLSPDRIARFFMLSGEYRSTHRWDSMVPQTAHNVYVDANIASEGDGSRPDKAFRTLARAAQAVRSAGTTVWVAPGEYEGGIVTVADGGTATKDRIYWVSTTRWGAKIVPPALTASGAGKDIGWNNSGNNVSILGFEVDGTRSGDTSHYANWRIGIYSTGGGSTVNSNYVHDVARSYPCTGGGGAGIDMAAYGNGENTEASDNWVADIGTQNGCNKIQGIYMANQGAIKNNVVYRVQNAAIHLWHEASRVKIFNNTVAGSPVGILVGAGDQHIATSAVVADYIDVHNNISIGNGIGIREYTYGGEEELLGTHNTYHNNVLYQNTKHFKEINGHLADDNMLDWDPGFVVPYVKTTRLQNFHLASGSLVIGHGNPDTAPPYDFDGRKRNGNAVDPGAHEH
jgi:hypothetical protein